MGFIPPAHESLSKCLFSTTARGLTLSSLYLTSMHDAPRVHMFQGTADLLEIFPNSTFRNETSLLFEMLKK